MSISTALVAKITGYAAFNTAAGSRLYPDTIPQTPTLPSVSFFRVDTPRVASHDGDDTLVHPRYQFDIYAGTYLETETVAAALRGALAASGSAVRVVNEFDDPGEVNDMGRYRRVVDAIVWSNEA